MIAKRISLNIKVRTLEPPKPTLKELFIEHIITHIAVYFYVGIVLVCSSISFLLEFLKGHY